VSIAPSTSDAASFYGALSATYDDMTGTGGREHAARRFVDRLCNLVSARSGLDVACGTGVFTRALARSGITVTGCDISPDMLAVAERNGQDADLEIAWTCAPMQGLPDALAGPFDIVLCMGNSLPHLLDSADLSATLSGFARRQERGGLLALHVLNYRRVLTLRERFVGAERRGDNEYIRFYDFEDGLLRFNVLHLAWQAGTAVPQLHSTPLRPYTDESIVAGLQLSGYEQVEVFGGLDFSVFDPTESDTLLLTARREDGE